MRKQLDGRLLEYDKHTFGQFSNINFSCPRFFKQSFLGRFKKLHYFHYDEIYQDEPAFGER